MCFVGSLETTVGTQRNFPYECRVDEQPDPRLRRLWQADRRRLHLARQAHHGRHNEIYSHAARGDLHRRRHLGRPSHRIQHIHDTCRETGDHGPFNAWGRDSYWCLVQSHTPHMPTRSHDAGNVCADAMETVYRPLQFCEEASGWGIDLDDGASNYVIYHNLCVGVSMKLREGAYRTIENNIWVNPANSPCFHVGNDDNHDRYVRNITVMSVGAMQPKMT